MAKSNGVSNTPFSVISAAWRGVSHQSSGSWQRKQHQCRIIMAAWRRRISVAKEMKEEKAAA